MSGGPTSNEAELAVEERDPNVVQLRGSVCLRCGHALAGLTAQQQVARCPECGYANVFALRPARKWHAPPLRAMIWAAWLTGGGVLLVVAWLMSR